MAHRPRFLVLFLISLLGVACGASKTNVAAGSGNSLEPGGAEPDGHQAAQASFESGDNAATNDNEAGVGTQSSAQALSTHTAPRTAPISPYAMARQRAVSGDASITDFFSVQGCDALLEGNLAFAESVYTFDGNITFDPNGCTRSRKLAGSASITGSITGGIRTIAITEDMGQTLVNGDVVAISSALAGQPTYLITASGAPAQGNTSLSVTVAEHRNRLASTGNVVFDLTIATDANAPLQIVNSYQADANGIVGHTALQARTIISGVNTVTHNLAHYTAVHTFDHLHHALDTCNCPDSGSLKEDVTYTDTALGSYSRVYTFTACGEASVVTSSSTHPNVITGTSQVTWDSCH